MSYDFVDLCHHECLFVVTSGGCWDVAECYVRTMIKKGSAMKDTERD